MEQDEDYEQATIGKYGRGQENDSVFKTEFTKSTTTHGLTDEDDPTYAAMGPTGVSSSPGLMKLPTLGSPPREKSYFSERSQWQPRPMPSADEDDTVIGPPGPRLPPKITPPSKPPPLPKRTSDLDKMLGSNSRAISEVPNSPTGEYVYRHNRPTVHLTSKERSDTSPTSPRLMPEYDLYSNLSGRKLSQHPVAEIGEKYKNVERAVRKCQEHRDALSDATEMLKDSIMESKEESLKNVDWIERSVLKDIRIRSKSEDQGAEIIHNALQTFRSLEKKVNEVSGSNRSDQVIIDKALDVSRRLKSLLQREIVNAENKAILFIEDYCDLSVGTLLNKMMTRCVGIVGRDDRSAIVVTDHRDTMGLCFGLWSKNANKCLKWEVVFQPKDTVSQVVISPSLGKDSQNRRIMAIGIGETLHLVQVSKIFQDESGPLKEVERTVKLRLGFGMSSVVFVEEQPTLVCIGCNKQNSVTVFDCKGSDDQILSQINIIGGELFHLSFATMLVEGGIQLGVLLKTGNYRESILSLIDRDGIIRQMMPKIAVKEQKVIPFAMTLSNYQNESELSVLFFNQIASCQYYIGKFDYSDLTPNCGSVSPVSTNSRIPVSITNLPGSNVTVIVFTNSDTLMV